MWAMRRLGVLIVLIAAACPPTVTIEGRKCDSDGTCPGGLVCIEQLCQHACKVGDSRSCSFSNGDTCLTGTQQCIKELLAWSPCVAPTACARRAGVCEGKALTCEDDAGVCTSHSYGINFQLAEYRCD